MRREADVAKRRAASLYAASKNGGKNLDILIRYVSLKSVFVAPAR